MRPRTPEYDPMICTIAVTGNSIVVQWEDGIPEITRDYYWREWIRHLYHARTGKWINRPEGNMIDIDTYRPIDPKRST